MWINSQLDKFSTSKGFSWLKMTVIVYRDDIDGSMVAEVYWKEKNIERIATYCQKDVLTTANIIMRFKNLPLLKEAEVVMVK